MIKRVDHDVLLDHDTHLAQAGRQAGLEHEAQVVHEDGGATPGEIVEEQIALTGKIGCAGIHVEHGCAIGGYRRHRGRDDLADVIPEGLEGPPHPPHSMKSHLHDRGRPLPVAVTGNTLEVGVELEVFHRVFVVALHEADGRDLLADDPKDPKGDLVFVRAHHLDSTAVGLEHGRVVDPHPVSVGDRGLLVGVDGSHVEARVASA